MPFSDDIRTGIYQTAQSLGVDPLDVATIISYETGGTFDPLQKGPTTKWGTHRGYLQFGEPQAKQHGVDWSDPVRSQLGPNGAVVSYLRAAGVKPGMGLLDLYSAVNAGAPGLYNRSDEAAGGAPGTVYDKVTQQMGPHRDKAAALLGGDYTPSPASRPMPNNPPPYPGGLPPTGMPPLDAMPMPDVPPPSGQQPSPQTFSLPQSGYDSLLEAYRQQLAANTPGAQKGDKQVRSAYSTESSIIRY